MARTSIDRSTHAEKAATRFDAWAESYGEDRIAGWLRHYQSLALSQLGVENGGAFLDVGCGDGWAVKSVAERSPSGLVAGIDVSPRMIEKARARNRESARVDLRVADAVDLPYRDATFRWVLCTFSFHHYSDPAAALREIHRVMQSGGRFVLLDSARDVFFPIWLQDRFRRYLEKSHVRYYTRSELKMLFAQAEFRTVGEVVTIRDWMDRGKLFTGLAMIEGER